jgi:X-Pro dipeptidyl-peptidase
VYVTPVLDQDVRISGTPELDVRFTSSSETALLSAMIVDYGEAETVTVEGMTPLELVEASCDPEDLAEYTGCATPQEVSVEITPQRVLAWGHVDGKNHVDLRRGSALEPGEDYRIQWETQPVEHVIPAGHRIGLVLTGNYRASPSSNSPAVDGAAIGAQVTVLLDQSRLHLPVVGGASVLGF